MNSNYINYLSPCQILNLFKGYNLSNLIQNNQNYLSNTFSQLGYQILNPQFLSYKLEPIYSSCPNISFTKSNSCSHNSKIEIGRPVETNNNQYNKRYNYAYNNENVTPPYNNKSELHTGINTHKSDTDYILETINKLKLSSSKNNSIQTTSTREHINHEDYMKNKDKKPLFMRGENVSPFDGATRASIESNKGKRRNNIGEGMYKSRKMKVEINPHLRIHGNMNQRISSKRRIKRNWVGLFKNFIKISAFFSWAKKCSSFYSETKNNSIFIRTIHIVNDIAVLKDWIITMEESFFNEFGNYEDFNLPLNLKTQGDKNQISKKTILNIISLFIDNLESNLDNIPENVQSILYEYIKNRCYYPKKFLSKFQIYRLDFNFNGSTKKLSICQCAMILSYFIINGICVQQILLHIKDVFTEYSNYENIEEAVINIGSILHYLVRDIFKKKQKKINDVLALFNYYRSYHLYNEKVEKYKDKFKSKINIEENDNDDEYIEMLLPYKEVREFFEDNSKYFEKIKESLYNWSTNLAEKIKNKYADNENDDNNDNITLNKKKKRKIKSSIYG